MPVVGYTCGVFDLFHVGHVNLLRNAKARCDVLIAAVTVDELVAYKGKQAVIPFEDRIQVVRACKYVDSAVPQRSIDKVEAWHKLKFDILFVGDDWYGNPKWKDFEARLAEQGVVVVYIPYTEHVSSTKLRTVLGAVREDVENTAVVKTGVQ